MENVEEIQQWGPLDERGRPIPERKGEEYQKFIRSMKSLGYDFDSRELVAADYGAPTTRKRWYAIFRRDRKPIVWPEATHSKDGSTGKKWLECGDYIDWTDLGKSKIEAWEAEKEIKVGDVVIETSEVGNEYIGVVTQITSAQNSVCMTYSDGSVGVTLAKRLKKTGRHIDIEELLKQIGGIK